VQDGAKKKNGAALFGRVLCVAGIVLAVIGALFVSVALGGVGIVFGIVGYALGARRLGMATVVVGVVSVFVGLLVGQGVMAGSYDRAVDGWFRNTPVEQITDE
jgi:hypothetical protein